MDRHPGKVYWHRAKPNLSYTTNVQTVSDVNSALVTNEMRAEVVATAVVNSSLIEGIQLSFAEIKQIALDRLESNDRTSPQFR
jgi:hypothetical protein